MSDDFPGDELQLDLLSAVARLQQVEDEGGFDTADEVVVERLLSCDLPRLRGHLLPSVIAWAEEDGQL